MTKQIVPAKAVNEIPRFQFAVLSVRKGQETADLESSFENQEQAEGIFNRQYSKWGMPDTNFYLVDWMFQNVLKSHEVWAK